MEELGIKKDKRKLCISKRWRDIIIIIILNGIYSSIILVSTGIVWPRSPDAIIYADMAKGKEVVPPFKYRCFVPFIVSLFPESYHIYVFLAITLTSLTLACVILYLFLERKDFQSNLCLMGILFFMGSWTFNKYIFNFGLVDPLFFVFVFLIFYLLTYKTEEIKIIILIILTFIIGFFIKEAIIFFMPIVMIEAFFNKNKIMFLSMFSLLIIFIILVLARETAYDSLEELVMYNLKRNNIDIKKGFLHVAILFVIGMLAGILINFGLLLFCSLAGFFKSELKKKLEFIVLSLEVLFGSFIVTDWWRLLTLLFPYILVYGLTTLSELQKIGEFKEKRTVSILIILTIIWSISEPAYLLMQKNFGIVFPIIVLKGLLGLVLFIYYIIIMKKKTKQSYNVILFKNLDKFIDVRFFNSKLLLFYLKPYL